MTVRSRLFTMDTLYEMARRDPMKTFDDWPIFEIRKKCWERMKEGGLSNCQSHADWIEEKIRDLFLCVYSTELEELGEAMLGWYVFACDVDYCDNRGTKRSVEFALSLVNGENTIWSLFLERVVSKFVTGRLLKNDIPGLYSQLLSLPKFLEKLLDGLNLPSECSHQYFDDEWIRAERALRVIVNEKDFSFLPKIEKLIILLQEGKILPRSEIFFTKARDLATLVEAKKILLKARKKSLTGEQKSIV